jgi:histidyl-tRNA synthetase
LCGGGRYDGLAEAIGGPPTPGVGVGIGIERIAIGLKKQGIEPPAPPAPPVLVAHFGGATKGAAVQIASELRRAGLGAYFAFAHGARSLKSQMREADRLGVRYVVIVGEAELAAGQAAVRPMAGGEQTVVAHSDLAGWLQSALAVHGA